MVTINSSYLTDWFTSSNSRYSDLQKEEILLTDKLNDDETDVNESMQFLVRLTYVIIRHRSFLNKEISEVKTLLAFNTDRFNSEALATLKKREQWLLSESSRIDSLREDCSVAQKAAYTNKSQAYIH